MILPTEPGEEGGNDAEAELSPGRINSTSIGMRIDLLGWRGSTGDIPPMAGLYWRIYYQIENPRIGDLQWRSSTGGPLMAGYRICEG